VFLRGARSVLRVRPSTPVALAGCQIVSIIIQVCLSYNVILNVWTVIVVSDLMRSASDRTDIIPECPGINPSCLGRFSHIVNIYAQLLGLEDDIQKYLLFQQSRCFLT
jgi:hypothetical protein